MLSLSDGAISSLKFKANLDGEILGHVCEWSFHLMGSFMRELSGEKEEISLIYDSDIADFENTEDKNNKRKERKGIVIKTDLW